jgi:hypothetical protein
VEWTKALAASACYAALMRSGRTKRASFSLGNATRTAETTARALWVGALVALASSVGCGGSTNGTGSVKGPVGVACDAHPVCSADGPPCATGTCAAIAGCPSALCIDTDQACRETCGDAPCLVLESYPVQLSCEGVDPAPGRIGGSGGTGSGGTSGTGGASGGAGGGIAPSCADVEAEYRAQLDVIQSCQQDAECGQVLLGTSCGCTRDLVARSDADTTRFEQLRTQLQNQACDLGASTCDCPEADGFVCTQGRCAWNYTQAP